jgi:ParB/RepB/Spo0J family partition protein
MPRYELIPIEQLLEPEIAAREAMDDEKLTELADSVREVGFIHPLAVVLVQSGQASGEGRKGQRKKTSPAALPPRYEIVDGHRRYKIGGMLQQNALPCLIFDDAETARHAVKLHANLYREDLSTAEEAAYLADLIGKYDYTEEQLCRSVRQKASWINERLALLRGDDRVFNALRERKINLAIAKQLNRCASAQRRANATGEPIPEGMPSLEEATSHTSYLLNLVIDGGATAVTVARWVAEYLSKRVVPSAGGASTQSMNPQIVEAPLGPECIFCRKQDAPHNLVNVWIHQHELVILQYQLSGGQQPPGEVQ